MTSPRPVTTDRAPAPGGHYSQAVVAGDMIFVSGQLPIGQEGADGFDGQARLVLAHLRAIVEDAGSGLDRVVKVTAYIVGIEHWPAFDAAFAEAFGTARPARAVVTVPELHHGYLVEVEAVAML